MLAEEVDGAVHALFGRLDESDKETLLALLRQITAEDLE